MRDGYLNIGYAFFVWRVVKAQVKFYLYLNMGVKRPVCKADHSPVCDAEVKIA